MGINFQCLIQFYTNCCDWFEYTDSMNHQFITFMNTINLKGENKISFKNGNCKIWEVYCHDLTISN